MKLEYTYTFAEYKALNVARQRRYRFVRLRDWFFWGLVIVNAGLSMWLIFSSYRYQVALNWWMFANLAIAITALAYRFVLSPYWLRWYYNQQMLDGNKMQLNVSDQGLDTATDNVTGHYNWTGLIAASEEAGHFVIWVNKMQGICIPKPAFEHKEQMDEFRKIVAANIDDHDLQI